MDSKDLEILGAWIQAIGNLAAAMGTTLDYAGANTAAGEGLELSGNGLQAAGSLLQAKAQPGPTLERIGNEVQAAGNITVIIGKKGLFAGRDSFNEKLVVTGDWLQSYGSLVELWDEFVNGDNPNSSEVTANFIQSAGSAIQAIGGMIELRGNVDLGARIVVTASWIQASGALLEAISEMKDEE